MSEVAFAALIHSIGVKLSPAGDKEGTLVLKFRPDGNEVADLNALMVEDQAVMIGLVQIDETVKSNAISKGPKRKQGRKAEGTKE